MTRAIATVESIIDSVATLFTGVGSYGMVEFTRESEFATQLLYAPQNNYLREIALKNPQSLKDAITNVAALELTLNPASKLAYLVPRKSGICLDVSYMGLRELATSTGAIRFAKAELVHDKDIFILNGIDKEPTHNFKPFARDRGHIIGVYCIAKLPTGEYITEMMDIDSVYDIRDRSDAWKAWVSKQKKCPWVTDEDEMIKKTVIKRGSKSWPRVPKLDKALHMLNTVGGEGIDLSGGDTFDGDGVSNAKPKFTAGPILANIRTAQNDEEIRALRRQGLEGAKEARDKYAYDQVVKAVRIRREQLGIILDAEVVPQ